FKVLLPVLGPRPAVVINEARIACRELAGSSINIAQVAQAFDVGVASGRVIQAGLTVELHGDMQRLNESVRIVKHGFMLETNKVTVVEDGRIGFDGLELIAVLEHGV